MANVINRVGLDKNPQTRTRHHGLDRLRIGFVPLTDCAPFVVAKEFGLFDRYGLCVELSRELGWASVRDKIIHGELHAAHAVAGMPFATTLGLNSIRCECLTALVLNQHGNAITMSNRLWQQGVRDNVTLKLEIRKSRLQKTLTFGVVFRFSSHNFLLREWLRTVGIEVDRDVRIVVVPPPQMAVNLKAGHLDGFCAGEPWNSVAVKSKAGWITTTSAELAPNHPEKVLMVRQEFAERHEKQHLALIAALLDACRICDSPESRNEIIALLARPEYVGTPVSTLRPAFDGNLNMGHGQNRFVPDFNLFHQDGINDPSVEKAAWVLRHLRATGLCKEPGALTPALSHQVFRSDIFQKAIQVHHSNRLEKIENHHTIETCA
jgi:ABC-type nitrate/sulfonate/bicarbonate transport system substrate-binding protein